MSDADRAKLQANGVGPGAGPARQVASGDESRPPPHHYAGYGGGFEAMPRIAGVGMVSRNWTGSTGSSGNYYEDFEQRAAYGGFAGAIPDYGAAEAASLASRAQSFHGVGPKGYVRSDGRIHEDVCDRLTEDPYLDAREIVVQVAAGEVSLDGTVPNRASKRRAEDVAETVAGVKHVQNNLRVHAPGSAHGGEIVRTMAGEPVPGVVADVSAGKP